MKLSDLLKPEFVRIGLKMSLKEEILLELASFIANTHPSVNQKEAYRALLDREQKGSTGISQGLAVPHGRSSEVKGMHLVVVYDPKGKDFDSSDGNLSHLFFTVVAADTYSPHEQLEILRIVAEIYEKTDLKERIRTVQTSQELFSLLQEKELETL